MGTNGSSTKKQQVEIRQLPVKLTKEELLARGDELASIELTIEELKAERSATQGKINEEIKKRKILSHTIDRGTEDRDVKCVWVEDFPKNVHRLKREDDGTEVDTRPMTADDRTGSLFAAQSGDESELGVPPPRAPRKRATKKRAAKAEAPSNVRHINA